MPPLYTTSLTSVSFNDGTETGCEVVYIFDDDPKEIIAGKLRILANIVERTGCANAEFMERDE